MSKNTDDMSGSESLTIQPLTSESLTSESLTSESLTSQQSQISSNQNNSHSGSQGQGGAQGMANMVPNVLTQVLDRLSGKDGIIAFTFDNLVVDIPRMQGPGGKDMGSAKWTINGTLRIKAGAEQHHSGTTL